MAVNNVNFDQILTTTLANHRKKMVDNIFLTLPLFWWLTQKNRVRFVSGGHKIVEELLYGEGEAAAYDEYGQITITPQDGITAAEFPWRAIASTIAISGLQEAKNNGEEQMINLLKAKVMQSEKTLRKLANTMAWGDNTADAGNEWLGLKGLIGDGTTSVTTVGNIDATDGNATWWRSNYERVTGDTTYANLVAKMTTDYNDVGDGTDVVDAIFQAQDVFEAYEATLTPNVRYEDVASANAGFTTLKFKQAPVYFDKAMEAGSVYGLNSDYLGLVGHKNRWFKQSKFSPGLGADASSAHATNGTASTIDARYATISAFGNMTVSNRSKHFRIDGLGQNLV